jgi:hypothetical protein
MVITLDNYDPSTLSPAGAQKILEFDVNIVECMVVITYDKDSVNTYQQLLAENVDEPNTLWFETKTIDVFAIYESGIFEVNCNLDLVYTYFLVKVGDDDRITAPGYTEIRVPIDVNLDVTGRTIEYNKCASATST